MSRYLVLAIALITAAASAVPAANPVRTLSGPCGAAESDARVLQGSGFAFRLGDKGYAVGAEPRVYLAPEDAHFCTTVQGRPARPIAAEWGNGLVLLELTDQKPAADWPTFEDIAGSFLHGTQVMVDGYPGKSGLGIGVGGRVISLQSPRHHLPLIDRAIEVEGAAVRSGMIGGPVTGENGFVGVVSPYYLRLDPGHPTRIRAWKPTDTEAQVRIVVTPIAAVRAWLAPLAAGKPFPRAFRREASAQLQGLLRLTAGRLVLEEVPAPAESETPESGDFPVGGGQGVGVGGAAALEAGAKVRVTARAAEPSDYAFPGHEAWHVRAQALVAQSPLELPFLFRLDAAGQIDRYRTFGSAAEFFTALRREPGLEIATIRDAGDEKLARLRELARKTARDAFLYFRKPAFVNERVLFLVRQLYAGAKLLDSEARDGVRSAALAPLGDLDGPFKQEWALLLHPLGGQKAMHEGFLALVEEWRKLGG